MALSTYALTSKGLTTSHERISLLSLISNLSDSLQKAYIYAKIDLWHIYYLVWVIEGNE